MLIYKSIILFTGLFAISLYADAALNDTGITTCSNETQNGLPCPVAGFPGQDAEYGTNSFDFTKLDANGNAMAVAATNHSCVQDNVTGLMWEVKTDDGGLRDKDNTYTFDEAATFATNVNATNLCGHNDWRVPNPHELASIVDYSIPNPGPTIDENFFPNTSSTSFWTNTPYATDSGGSWIIYFHYGYAGYDYRSSSYAVRLVREDIMTFSNFSFIDQGNGTVTEQSTGLMWAKCSLGQGVTDCSGSANFLTWQQALQAADNSTLAGYTNWRLPNVKELQTLVDYTKYNPSINTSVFTNTSSVWYYSSSPSAADSSGSWLAHFGYGLVYYKPRAYGNVVRLVRNVQNLSSFSLNVTKTGNGAGSITSNLAGINCGSDCNENYASGTVVTLTATPDTGSMFSGWTGDADCSDGTVTMDAAKNCTATFNLSITRPTATTGTATNITQTSAKLNGTVISSSATATVSFEFGKETSTPAIVAIVPTLQRGNTYRDAPASHKVAQTDATTLERRGLRSHAGAWERSETHYSPLLLRRGSGGEVKSFTYTETISATPSSVYSSTAVAVSTNKTGLTCGTTYHYRVTAANSAGTTNSADKAFSTSACPPPTGYTVTATTNPVAGNVAGSFIPETAQTVTAGATTSFTVTANEGYITNSAVTGTCPLGSWNDKVWTTGLITANCTVIFGFTAVTSWISPPNQTVIPAQAFTLDITVKSTSVKVGQYTFVITFDPNKLRLDTTYADGTALCINGVCPGINALSNRFIPVINNDTITLNGNDPIGKGPGNDLQLLVIHFKSRYVVDAPSFTTNVTLQTNLLTTTDGDNIGTGARGATVNVSTGLCGDATGDTVVNIIDALGIARKIVGMPPPPTVDIVLADVNEDGRVAITDAMHIARYSVGLVTPPEVCKFGEAF